MDDGLLASLAAESKAASARGRSTDAGLSAQASALLFHEARLLDESRLREWLELLTDDFVYWVPTHPVTDDPRRSVAIALDDRRRIEDRVVWILGGRSFAQQPQWVTARQVSNVEAWPVEPDQICVRSTFAIHARRREETHLLGGWVEHRLLVARSDDWRIMRKRVHLVDADLHRRNFTFIL